MRCRHLRRIGELGIGCNPGITRYMGNVYFDETIDGPIHIVLGSGLADLGGTNESAIHWDIVKDLRSGGRIELGRVTLAATSGAWHRGARHRLLTTLPAAL